MIESPPTRQHRFGGRLVRYRFYTCDVFTDRVFGGNQLAVLTDARGLDTARMQAIAAEFGYSETTFVLPPDDPRHAARVRIFTPRAEIGFAGHPTVGTALVLAWTGAVPVPAEGAAIVLEEGAGPVPVEIRAEDGRATAAEFVAPVAARAGAPVDPGPVAHALGLDPADLAAEPGLPCVASTGVPFLCVRLVGLDALARARLDPTAVLPGEAADGVLLFTTATGSAGHDLRARMYAPRHGIAEDPATGSAAAALAGLLAARSDGGDGWLGWRIGQGIEMGRPSLILARARRAGGQVAEVRVGGGAVPVAEGWIEVPAA